MESLEDVYVCINCTNTTIRRCSMLNLVHTCKDHRTSSLQWNEVATTISYVYF